MPRKTKATKGAAEEGVPADLDLGHAETPSENQMQELDAALDEAGVHDVNTTPAAEAPAEEVPADEVPADQVIEKQAPLTDTPLKDLLPPGTEKPVEVPGEKPAEVPAETPSEKPVVKKPVDEEPAKENFDDLDLDAIQPPPGVSPRNLVNFNKLREVSKHYKEVAAAIPGLQKQLTELQARGTVPEEVTKELEDLRNFRKIFDTENDPEFKAQFDGKLEALDTDLLGLLVKNGLPQETADSLKAQGLGTLPAEFWEEQILPKLSFVDRQRIEKRLAERADLSDQKLQAVEKFASQRTEVLAEQEKKQMAAFLADQEKINQHVAAMVKDIPWATPVVIPEKGTKEEKAAAEAHNAEVARLSGALQEALYPATPQARAEIAAAAVASTVLASSVNDLSSRLKAANERAEKLQKDLDAIKSAGKMPTPTKEGRRVTPEVTDTSRMSDDEAIEQGLKAAEGL
ncbi:MAG: hypothetical protein M0Q93_00215 [Terrimicrobiaceae bacterium]|nr:hypothetical protein [Terrimicrobiaceae bacterium]